MSMAPTAVRMVLVEGENGDGPTVDEDNIAVETDQELTAPSAAEQVVSAILGTREGAAEGGYQLASTGVTWTDPISPAVLRDALAARKVENVMLVSAFLAAAALAQSVGSSTNYAQTALLFVEPDTATLAVVDSADGSVKDIHRTALPEDDDAAVAQLAEMVSSAEALETRPDAVFVVGSGVDIPLIKPALEAATTLPLAVPEEPETALARGAALASANTPLFVSSTAALAWAQDPGTGAYDPSMLDAAYFDDVSDRVDTGSSVLAYSAVPSELTGQFEAPDERKSFGLVGSVLLSIFVIGVASLVVALAVSIRTTSATKPDPGSNLVAPAAPAPAPEQAPVPAPQAPAPAPEAVPPAPAPAPQAPAQVPEAPAPAPQAPVEVPQAPAPVPVPVEVPQAPAPQFPVPAAPAPVPAAPAPVPAAPVPVPVPIVLPPILGPQLPGLPGGGNDGIPGRFPGGGGGPGKGGGGGDGPGKGGGGPGKGGGGGPFGGGPFGGGGHGGGGFGGGGHGGGRR
ncbi:hypothetical protein A5657_15230 [Mycobacterium kubicae]|nr:hypothetical protein A5657_15230 [Mycobacterium kubicae]